MIGCGRLLIYYMIAKVVNQVNNIFNTNNTLENREVNTDEYLFLNKRTQVTLQKIYFSL